MKKSMVLQLLLCLSLAGGAAADVEIRKNWQCLSDARKKQFVETLEIMRKRDASTDDWSLPSRTASPGTRSCTTARAAASRLRVSTTPSAS